MLSMSKVSEAIIGELYLDVLCILFRIAVILYCDATSFPF